MCSTTCRPTAARTACLIPEPVGTQSINTASLPAGSYSFEAQYLGDGNYQESPMSAPEPLTINQGSSSVSTAISDSGGGVVTSVLGEKVYDTATVTGTPAAFAPTGNVKYYFSTDGGTTYSLFDTEPVGTQSINTASLPAGSYSFEAQYSGDSNYAASPMSSPEPLTINKATPTVTVTDNGGIYTGSAYPATATATGVAGLPSPSAEGSSVTYTYYLGTYTLSQLAEETPLSPDVAPSAVGNYTVLASFTATTDYNASQQLDELQHYGRRLGR